MISNARREREGTHGLVLQKSDEVFRTPAVGRGDVRVQRDDGRRGEHEWEAVARGGERGAFATHVGGGGMKGNEGKGVTNNTQQTRRVTTRCHPSPIVVTQL